MKPAFTLLIASVTLAALTGAQPSIAADSARHIVVAQQTPSDNAKAAAEKARQQAKEKAQQAAEKAKAQAETQRKAAQEKAKAQAEAQRKAAQEKAKAQAEVQRKAAQERAKAQAEAQRNAAEERAKAQAEAKRRAYEKAKADAETRRRAEERAKTQAEAQRKADEKAKADAEAKRNADAKAKAEAAAKAKAEAEPKRKADEKARADAEAKQKADEKGKAAAQPKQQEAAPQPADNTRTGTDERQRSRRDGRPRDDRDRDRARRNQPQTPKQEEPAQQTVAPAQKPDSATQQRVAAPPPPTKPRSASEFIRRNRNDAPQRNLSDLRRERRETREGNTLVIHEGDRTIVRDGRRSFVRHNESDRLAVGARDVRVDRRNGETVTIIMRPNGVQIISTTDRDGDLIRRVRRDATGREIILVENRFAGRHDRSWFVDVRPSRSSSRHRRHILDARHASFEDIFWVLTAVPIADLGRRYTVEQVRYSDPLREYMPRIDLDIHFDSGSWQLTPSQIDKLSVIARALNRAIARDRREMYLVEGHTDAVGDFVDNMSLSDRRAEAVAVALTEAFGVPPENLVTQGYGEEYLKVPTEGPSRENRRVAVRRITPLIAEAYSPR